MKANLFNEASETYDSVSEVQVLSSAYLARMLKDSLAQSDAKSILDLGCGVGNTSLELMKIYPNADYILCDVSPNMIDKARAKIKNARHIVADAEQYDFAEQYSLGVSNMAMQWFESIDVFLGKILKNCSYFAFSTLSDGSFHSLESTYPSIEELKSVCEKHGRLIKFDVQKYDLQFENSFALARYFRKLGAAFHSHGKSPSREEKTTANYEIFFAIVSR
jgi:malonyl-ACP O-methyltransferase BioC